MLVTHYLRFIFLDRRPALQAVLRSLLVTYSAVMGSLLIPPPTSPDIPPEWRRHVEWINVLSQNLMAAANDLRPIQVTICSSEQFLIMTCLLRLVNTSNL